MPHCVDGRDPLIKAIDSTRPEQQSTSRRRRYSSADYFDKIEQAYREVFDKIPIANVQRCFPSWDFVSNYALAIFSRPLVCSSFSCAVRSHARGSVGPLRKTG